MTNKDYYYIRRKSMGNYARLLGAVLIQAVSDYLTTNDEREKNDIILDLESNELLNAVMPKLVKDIVRKLTYGTSEDLAEYKENLVRLCKFPEPAYSEAII